MPKVSVIMGIYNSKSKEYLEKSINSILNQTFTDFEYIICNDGSTNECIEWAKEICKGDKRVIFIENDRNRGLSYTLNHCLSIAKGEYIARMDDDDESILNRFKEEVEFLDRNKDIGLVSSNINLFDENGIYKSLSFPTKISKENFLFNSPIVHPAIMVRREAYELVNGYRDIDKTVRVEDYDLFMRMFVVGINMRTIQKVLFNYRDDKNTKKRRKRYRYRINEFLIRKENFKKLKLYPIGMIYTLKPLLVGLVPNKIIQRIKKGTAIYNDRIR